MDQAWHWAIVQAKLADATRDEPLLISQLVRIAMISRSCETIQRLCELSPPSTQQREQLEAILSAFDDVSPLVRAVDGERLLFGEWLFNLPKDQLYKTLWDSNVMEKGMPETMISWVRMRRMALKPAFLADHANYIRITHKNAQILERPYSPQVPSEDYGRHTLTGVFMPAVYRVGTQHWRIVAGLRITRAGLALLEYRTVHGTFPATLGELDLDGIRDPFTQDLLHYRPEGDGFLLYSVGEDQKDNGGAPLPERRDPDPRKKGQPEYDIAWRFPNPGQQTAQ